MKVILLLIAFVSFAHAESPIESILTEEAIRSLRDPFRAPNVVLHEKENQRRN